ncbi:hypothetical protein Poli38472_014657 [Pythium oligandrum]|uniref:Uncharacterized protein n=1 Tax=Pythium oligandrum TaxID=41045 RepID=A0A8K1CID1_PYTOL|nr:hypothetical protein Poli38472_014657 [Pythium oligandrum]|eukprot:TMW63952.1 hypothetical protein Poli38472_014657 [Pythium oligandrum]
MQRLLPISAVLVTLAHAQSCSSSIGDYCGNANGVSCCPDKAYCQAWNPDYYQCIAVPSGCGAMETDVDYYGGDITTIHGIQPWDCCAKCQETQGCEYFTFLNQAGPACHLKTSAAAGGRTRLVGAISGKRISPTPTPTTPAPSCSAIGSPCGNAQGSSCCATGGYCQPWDTNYYQCLSNAGGCGEMETDVDYYGNDIAQFSNIYPWDCCGKCQETPDCKYYTYVNLAPQGPTCYLKSSASGRVRSVGAVSGRRLTTPTPTTTRPTPSPSPTTPGTSQCSRQLNYTYFHGFDLKEVPPTTPGDCCTACAETVGCKVFTYFYSTRSGAHQCLLKTAAGEKTNYAGVVGVTAVSGYVDSPKVA